MMPLREILFCFAPLVFTSAEGPTTQSQPTSQSASDTDLPEKSALQSPTSRLFAAVAGARQTIVVDCAPALSLWLGGADADMSEIRSLCKDALAQLDAAEELMGDAELEAEFSYEMEDRIDLLRAFARMLAALSAWNNDDANEKSLLDACKGLAIYLDDPAKGVVESARLWQAVAYRRLHRPDRVLLVAHPSLIAPTFVRPGYLLRLERCLALGDRGMYAVGLALALKLDAAIDTWFQGADDVIREQAHTANRWTRIRLLRAWAQSLDEQNKPVAATHAREQAVALAGDDVFPPTGDRLLGLHETIAGLPVWKVPPSLTVNPSRVKEGAEETAPDRKSDSREKE